MLANNVSLCVVESFEGVLIAALSILATWVGAEERLVASFGPMSADMALLIPCISCCVVATGF